MSCEELSTSGLGLPVPLLFPLLVFWSLFCSYLIIIILGLIRTMAVAIPILAAATSHDLSELGDCRLQGVGPKPETLKPTHKPCLDL